MDKKDLKGVKIENKKILHGYVLLRNVLTIFDQFSNSDLFKVE
jgi:hypothetical protein